MIETLLIIGAALAVLYYAGDYVYHEYIKKVDVKVIPIKEDDYKIYDNHTTEITSSDAATLHDLKITNGDFHKCGKVVRQTILRYLDDPSKCDQGDFTFDIGKARIKYDYRMEYWKPAEYNPNKHEQQMLYRLLRHFKVNYYEKTYEYKKTQLLDEI